MDYIRDLEELTSALRALRRQRGMTQSDVAHRARISRPRLSLIERGRAPNMEVATLLRLLAAYDAVLLLGIGGRPSLSQIMQQRELEEARDAQAVPKAD